MAWYVPATQPGCKPCSVIFKMSLVVIVWPLGSKTGQTSKIRRDSENWVILGHTPKLPKIIDRRNVQVLLPFVIKSKVYQFHSQFVVDQIRMTPSGLADFFGGLGSEGKRCIKIHINIQDGAPPSDKLVCKPH